MSTVDSASVVGGWARTPTNLRVNKQKGKQRDSHVARGLQCFFGYVHFGVRYSPFAIRIVGCRFVVCHIELSANPWNIRSIRLPYIRTPLLAQDIFELELFRRAFAFAWMSHTGNTSLFQRWVNHSVDRRIAYRCRRCRRVLKHVPARSLRIELKECFQVFCLREPQVVMLS